MTKTRDQIEDLKLNWFDDPCWDLHTTEGFEDHKEELLKYETICHTNWKRRKIIREFENDIIKKEIIINELKKEIDTIKCTIIFLEEDEKFKLSGI